MSCIRSYDALCEALEAYEATHREEDTLAAYRVLVKAALRCGCGGQPVIHWSRQRVATYRATVTGAVSHLQSVIHEVCP